MIKYPSSTFIDKACSDSTEGAGIFDGDLLVVDDQTSVINPLWFYRMVCSYRKQASKRSRGT